METRLVSTLRARHEVIISLHPAPPARHDVDVVSQRVAGRKNRYLRSPPLADRGEADCLFP